MAGSDRRGFLSQIARELARAAGEIDAVLRDDPTPAEGSLGTLFPEDADADAAALPAEPAVRTATLEELRALCRDAGIGDWCDAAAEAAVDSIRLTPAPREARTCVGGTAALPPGSAWPRWRDEPLALLLQVALDELPPSPLPARGTLLVFFARANWPDGADPEHEGSCSVVLVDEDEAGAVVPGPAALAAAPLVPSVELSLPLEPPRAGGEVCDYEAWMEVRARLAELQGVALEDALADHRSLHRVLGHPDTLGEPMRPEPAEDPPHAWRLLVQLSSDPRAGLELPPDERLFVWIREADLRAARFDRVRAFVR